MRRVNAEAEKVGVFFLGSGSEVPLDVPDGTYVNLIDDCPVTVRGGVLSGGRGPVIFRMDKRGSAMPNDIVL